MFSCVGTHNKNSFLRLFLIFPPQFSSCSSGSSGPFLTRRGFQQNLLLIVPLTLSRLGRRLSANLTTRKH